MTSPGVCVEVNDRSAGRLGVGGIVGDEDDGQAVLDRMFEDEATEVAAEIGVELAERFVEQKRLGRCDKAAHQRDAGALAAGKRRGVAVFEAGEARFGERRANVLAALATVPDTGVEPEGDVCADR